MTSVGDGDCTMNHVQDRGGGGGRGLVHSQCDGLNCPLGITTILCIHTKV